MVVTVIKNNHIAVIGEGQAEMVAFNVHSFCCFSFGHRLHQVALLASTIL
jgi:hypothetical protein